MATTVIDDFNSYSDGDLNGQGSWSGDTQFDVEGTTVQEGAKAVSMVDSNLLGYTISKSVTARAQNIIGWYMRATATTTLGRLDFYSGATFKAQVALRPGASVQLDVAAGGSASIGTYSTGTWYLIELELDSANSQIRARFNGGAFSAWKAQAFTSIDTLKMSGGSDNTSQTIFWDNIYYDDQATSGPANLKTYNTNAKANIKTMNTNAIANVKTLDTNA